MSRYGMAAGAILSVPMGALGLWTLLRGDQGVGLSLIVIVIAIACWPLLGRPAARRRS